MLREIKLQEKAINSEIPNIWHSGKSNAIETQKTVVNQRLGDKWEGWINETQEDTSLDNVTNFSKSIKHCRVNPDVNYRLYTDFS